MNDPSPYSSTQDSVGGGGGEASKTAQAGIEQASEAAASVKDAAGDAVTQAKEQASSLVGQAKDKALAVVGDQKDGLADTLDALAQSVHKSADQFAGQQDWIASAVERGAAELGALATSLRENDLGSLVEQVKSIARRQPAVFVGACLAGGFAIARVGKLVAADVSRDDLPTMPEVGRGGR